MDRESRVGDRVGRNGWVGRVGTQEGVNRQRGHGREGGLGKTGQEGLTRYGVVCVGDGDAGRVMLAGHCKEGKAQWVWMMGRMGCAGRVGPVGQEGWIEESKGGQGRQG